MSHACLLVADVGQRELLLERLVDLNCTETFTRVQATSERAKKVRGADRVAKRADLKFQIGRNLGQKFARANLSSTGDTRRFLFSSY